MTSVQSISAKLQYSAELYKSNVTIVIIVYFRKKTNGKKDETITNTMQMNGDQRSHSKEKYVQKISTKDHCFLML